MKTKLILLTEPYLSIYNTCKIDKSLQKDVHNLTHDFYNDLLYKYLHHCQARRIKKTTSEMLEESGNLFKKAERLNKLNCSSDEGVNRISLNSIDKAIASMTFLPVTYIKNNTFYVRVQGLLDKNLITDHEIDLITYIFGSEKISNADDDFLVIDAFSSEIDKDRLDEEDEIKLNRLICIQLRSFLNKSAKSLSIETSDYKYTISDRLYSFMFSL